MKQKEKDEKKVVGASRLMHFDEQVKLLTEKYCLYINYLIEIGEKAKQWDDASSLDEEDRKNISANIQGVRYYVSQSHILYMSIRDWLSIKGTDKVSDAYNKIFPKEGKADFVIDSGHLKDYVQAMNNFVLLDAVKDALESNKDVIEDLYSKE